LELGVRADKDKVKEVVVVPCFGEAWPHDFREGKRISIKGLSFGAMFSPLVKTLGEGNTVGKKLGFMQATLSKGNNTRTSLVSCCGDEGQAFVFFTLVLYTGEEPGDSKPLTVSPLVVVDNLTILDSFSSNWVAQKVMSFYHVVGLLCEGFEDERALFTAIEARRHQNGLADSPSSISKLGNRGQRELKRLACSINYDLKRGHSSRGKGKGRGPTCY
jgi:hypothetical protein